MKTKMKAIVLSMIATAIITSCKKAGMGGDATLAVFLEHHHNNIKNHIGYPDTVFVKFDATELPGTSVSDFDTYFIGEEGEDHVHCHGFKAGKYYLYGSGFDSTIMQRVTGGMSVKIAYKERKEEIDIRLAVIE